MYPISGRILICLFSSWLTAICLAVTLLQQGGMENISHLHFCQTFNSTVVGGHMQKGRDWILVSAGSGRNRLQMCLWSLQNTLLSPGPWPVVFSSYRGHGAAQQAQRHRGTHSNHSHKSLQLGICPLMFITYTANTTQFNFVDYSRNTVNPVLSVCERPTWCTVRKCYKNRILLFAATSKSTILSVKVGKVCQGNTSHTSQRWRFMRDRMNFIKHF